MIRVESRRTECGEVRIIEGKKWVCVAEQHDNERDAEHHRFVCVEARAHWRAKTYE